MLEIRLLGGFDVSQDGEAIQISSRPAKVLLAYLALAAGKPQPRETVAGFLWPDSDETSARGNLRQALWRLRKAIGTQNLLSDSQMIALNCGADCWLDIQLLEDPSDQDLMAAVSAYRGYLLPGFYEDWVSLERDRLQAVFERKMQALLNSLQRQQKWSDLLQWAEHWIAFGQSPEPAYRASMIAHAAQGDLAAVAATYERCVLVMQQEIGVEPSEETRSLYDGLLHGQLPEISDRAAPTLVELQPKQRHNLPQKSTRFIGRDSELAAAKELLAANRLVTVLGPGGMGKTRLALEAAAQMVEQFRNGVYFVSLAPIDSAGQIIQTIAEAIGFPLSTEEAPKRQLLRHLRSRQYLLIIDNFEHLLDGAEILAEILQSAYEVKILVTSRERLNLQAEALLQIDGLAYPLSTSKLAVGEYDAVRLFVESARRLRPGFTPGTEDLGEVARICQMAQGMPLAILLAAAWADMLSPAEIASEMSQSLDFLSSEWRNVPERHRSVRAAIESSWRRLPESQRDLMVRLAVFRGGFRPDAAHAVTGASLLELADLVHKSLIRRDPSSGRYEIHELIRQYAWEQLESVTGAQQSVVEIHAAYFGDYMERLWEQLTGHNQLNALAELESDLENIRRAWRYWLKKRDGKRISQFLDSFWRAYEVRGWFNAGARLFADAAAALRQALAGSQDSEMMVICESAYAQALALQAILCTHLGDVEKGLDLTEESVVILRRLGRFDELAVPLTTLWWNATYAGARARITAIGLERIDIASQANDRWKQAYALSWQGREAGLRKDEAAAVRQLEEGLRRFQELGDAFISIWPSMELGNLAVRRGDLAEARRRYEWVLQACDEKDYDWGKSKATRYLGIIAAFSGEFEEARSYLRQGFDLADELGLPRDMVNSLYEMAVVEAADGDGATAVRLLTLIREQPVSDQTRTMSVWTTGRTVPIRDLAEELLAELKDRLPPGVYDKEVERGRALSLESVTL